MYVYCTIVYKGDVSYAGRGGEGIVYTVKLITHRLAYLNYL